jgi:3'(2'), 5'-bisphosphate nucleotidase
MNEKFLNIALQASVSAGREILKIFEQGDFEVEHKKDSSPVTVADKNSNAIITEFLEQTELPVLSEEGRRIPFSERRNWKRYWLVDPLDGTKEFVRKSTDFTVNIALIENHKSVLGVIYIPFTKELFFGAKEIGAFKYIVNSDESDFKFKTIRIDSKQLDGICLNPNFTITGSRSHINTELLAYYEEMKKKYPGTEIISRGSSLKFCLLAEGKAHIAPRIGPTYEWDTAAGHAILNAVGGFVFQRGTEIELIYNKETLLNPNFIAKNKIND